MARRATWSFAAALVLVTSGATARERPLLFVGQDLGALHELRASKCCALPDGVTAYVNLYDVLSPGRNFGGLGVDAGLRPIADESGWGAGPVSAWKSAVEFGAPRLAIGLSITEADQKDGLKRLAAGAFDPEIRQLAAFISKVDRPVLLRIGYEFDGAWNHGYSDNRVYVAAWRRIVDVLRAEGASNAVFVWQTSASPIDDLLDRGHDDIRDWYPGDGYVDWMALSWFLRPDEKPLNANAYRPPSARALADELLAFARAPAQAGDDRRSRAPGL